MPCPDPPPHLGHGGFKPGGPWQSRQLSSSYHVLGQKPFDEWRCDRAHSWLHLLPRWRDGTQGPSCNLTFMDFCVHEAPLGQCCGAMLPLQGNHLSQARTVNQAAHEHDECLLCCCCPCVLVVCSYKHRRLGQSLSKVDLLEQWSITLLPLATFSRQRPRMALQF